MQRDSRTTKGTPRWLFGIAAVLIVLYVVNVALRIAAVKFGADTWRVSDVGEFLLVLAGMVFFVAGLIADEERLAIPARAEGDSNSTQGGV